MVARWLAAYSVSALGTLEVVDFLETRLGLPAFVFRAMAIAFAAGLPLVLTLSIRRERALRDRESRLPAVRRPDAPAIGGSQVAVHGSDGRYHPGDGVDLARMYFKETLLEFDGVTVPFSVLHEDARPDYEVRFELVRDHYAMPQDLAHRKDYWLAVYRASTRTPPYDQLMARLCSIGVSADQVALGLQPTDYYSYIATNYSCDIPFPEESSATLRDTLEPGPALRGLEVAMSSNHLGLNCGLISGDGYLITPVKSPRTIHDPDCLEVSISRGLEWSSAVAGVTGAILVAGADELGMKPADGLDQLTYLGVLRDLRKCGKPEVFFLARTALALDEVRRHHRERVARSHQDFTRIEGIRWAEPEDVLAGALDQREAVGPNVLAMLMLLCRGA